MRLFFIDPPRITKANEKFISRGELAVPEYSSFPSLGLGYLAAVADKLGHRCKILDLNVMPWISEREVLDFSPDLLLLSSITLQYRSVKIIIQKMQGTVPIVLGGPHASIFKEKLLADGVDIIAIGEGENILTSLLDNFPNSLDRIPGIIFKRNSHIVDTFPVSSVDNLDTLPFPAWHYFDLNIYDNYYYGRKCLSVISSRGCPYQCVFCFKGVFGDKIRLRSARNIFQEVVFLKDKYGIGAIQFQDDTFTMNRRRIEEFCQLLIDNNIDIFWRCLGRADQVDFELLKLMQRAGCKSIAFGIESGNQEVLDKVGKKIRLEEVVKAIVACNKLGIVSKGYYIIGLPWETPHTAKETIKFAKKHRTTQLQFTLPIAFPGTELWNIGKAKGLPVEEHVESFCWDETRPPYSFSDYLTQQQVEHYILAARNIGRPGILERILKIIFTKYLKDYPALLKKILAKLRKR
jgi:magnesium-protoporphyrin IX monomethyl ester (oxidative) cyclase